MRKLMVLDFKMINLSPLIIKHSIIRHLYFKYCQLMSIKIPNYYQLNLMMKKSPNYTQAKDHRFNLYWIILYYQNNNYIIIQLIVNLINYQQHKHFILHLEINIYLVKITKSILYQELLIHRVLFLYINLPIR